MKSLQDDQVSTLIRFFAKLFVHICKQSNVGIFQNDLDSFQSFYETWHLGRMGSEISVSALAQVVVVFTQTVVYG